MITIEYQYSVRGKDNYYCVINGGQIVAAFIAKHDAENYINKEKHLSVKEIQLTAI